MIRSSRAFDANERVEHYQKAVMQVQQNALLFKGFLGPTVKDKPELTSVGHRAARAAGVIVDAAGKLRCPPGTPNANQFTDMQMSNCMTPSASTAARAASEALSSLLPGKNSPELVAEFRALGVDISDTVKKDKRRLTPEQKRIVETLAWNVSYWATQFGDFGDVGNLINNITGGANDSDTSGGLTMLTSIYVVGGLSSVKLTLQKAKEKWDKTQEQVEKYQKAFVERMDRLGVKAGKLSQKMQDSFDDVMKSIEERIRGIKVNAPTPVDRAVGKLDDASGLAQLPKADHATSAQIRAFNAEMLAKAPRWGKTTDDDIKEINDSGRYKIADLLTLEERQTQRRAKMSEKISNLRRLIESGVQADENGRPLSMDIDPKTHEFILTHTDDEVIAAIEQTALTIARARKPEASVWGKGQHLEAYLTNGYVPTQQASNKKDSDAKVGEGMESLLGTRGQYEASVGAEGGVRPIYGFSRFTFWDDELKRITDEKNAKRGTETYSTDHYLTIGGKGESGVGDYAGAFAGDGIGYGDMEFVLHAEVADRTVTHHNDSILAQARGTAAVGAPDEELVEAYAGHLTDSAMDDNINRLLRTHVTQDFVNWNKGSGNNEENLNPNGQYTEAQILGGFTAQDIKEIKFDARRLFPAYKSNTNPDGVDGVELIQKIEDQHLSTEQLLAAGFTMGEIEVARTKISGWKIKNANGATGAKASNLGEPKVDGLISAMEMERITSVVNEKAPNAKLIFGSGDGLDLANPTTYVGGKVGDRITDIWGQRVREQLLEDVQKAIRQASEPAPNLGTQGGVA